VWGGPWGSGLQLRGHWAPFELWVLEVCQDTEGRIGRWVKTKYVLHTVLSGVSPLLLQVGCKAWSGFHELPMLLSLLLCLTIQSTPSSDHFKFVLWPGMFPACNLSLAGPAKSLEDCPFHLTSKFSCECTCAKVSPQHPQCPVSWEHCHNVFIFCLLYITQD
jgi:hypothetical protein